MVVGAIANMVMFVDEVLHDDVQTVFLDVSSVQKSVEAQWSLLLRVWLKLTLVHRLRKRKGLVSGLLLGIA